MKPKINQLLGEYAALSAAMTEACAPIETEIATLNAALTVAREPMEKDLATRRAALLALAQEPGFVNVKAHGFRLALSPSRAVVMDGTEEETVEAIRRKMEVLSAQCSVLSAGKLTLPASITEAVSAEIDARLAQDGAELERLQSELRALEACLNVKTTIAKQYVLSCAEESGAWFDELGLCVEERQTPTLKPLKKGGEA